MKRILRSVLLALLWIGLAAAQAGPVAPLSPQLEFANELNLVVSIAVWAIAFFVLLLPKERKPATLRANPFLVNILWYWFAQWLCLILNWLLLVFRVEDLTWILLLADLQSLLAIGFSISFLMGSNYPAYRGRVIGSLVLLFTVFLIFDVGTGLHVRNIGSPASLLQNWRLAPSQVLSVVADGFLALAFLFRYGTSALPIILACIAYAALQHPAYQSLVTPAERANARLVLAVGKVFLGSTFCATFFQRAANYDPIKLPIPDSVEVGPVLQSGVKYLIGFVTTCVVFSYFTPSPWLPQIRRAGLTLLGLIVSAIIAQLVRKPIAKLLRWFSKKTKSRSVGA